MRGRLEPRDAEAVAIVGSRQCTPYGRRTAEQTVGRHRDPIAVDDRVGRRNRERGGQDAGGQHVDARPDEENGTTDPRPELEHQHRPDRKQAAHERRHERAEQQTGAEYCDERSDLAARQPLLPADDDHGEEHAGPDEVPEPEEQRARAQERLPPDELKALGKPRAQ